MNCPRCHVALIEETYLGYKLNTCPQCQGKLLPQVKLIGLIEKIKSKEITQDTVDNEKPDPAQTTNLSCPKCSAKMSNHGYMGVKSITIDTCIDCELVWTDNDELQRMSELYIATEQKSKARRIKEKKQQDSDTLGTVLETRGKTNALFASPLGFQSAYQFQVLKEERASRLRKNPKQAIPKTELVSIIVFTLIVFTYSTYGLITGEFWNPFYEANRGSGLEVIVLEGTRRYFGFATVIFIMLAIVSHTINLYRNDASLNYLLPGRILFGLGFITLLLAIFWPIA